MYLGAASNSFLVNPQKPHLSYQVVTFSAEIVQAVNKRTLGGVSPWFGVPALCWVCLRKALSGGKLCRTIGDGVFLLETVAIYRNK